MTFSGIFAIGVSGVNAFAAGLESVSSNIANTQTTGYKRLRTDFADLIPRNAPDLNEAVGSGVVGSGVGAQTRLLIEEQGAVTRTGNATDLAIAGEGFFVVTEDTDASPADGAFLFTRAGAFRADAAGNLVNEAGLFLRAAPAGADGTASIGALSALEVVNINRSPPLAAGAPALGALTGVAVDDNGSVNATFANGEVRTLYEIPLALFANAAGLEDAADTTFRTTPDAGTLTLARSREGRAGAIENSALEQSTVDIGQEFSTLIATQQAYSTNARVISVADELWRTLTETAA